MSRIAVYPYAIRAVAHNVSKRAANIKARQPGLLLGTSEGAAVSELCVLNNSLQELGFTVAALMSDTAGRMEEIAESFESLDSGLAQQYYK